MADASASETSLNPHDDIPLNPFKLGYETTTAHQVNLLAIETDLPQSLWGDYERAVAGIESRDRRMEYDRNLAQRLLLHARVNAKHGLNHEFDPAIQIVQYEQELDDAYEWPAEAGEVAEVEPVVVPIDAAPAQSPPTPIGGALKVERPDFPYEVLPDDVSDFIIKWSAANSFHPDIGAIVFLGFISAVANHHRYEIYEPRQDWTQRLNLYVLCSSDPAAGKTPVFDAIGAPFEAMAKRFDEAADEKRKDQLAELKLKKRRMANAERVVDNENAPESAVDDAKKAIRDYLEFEALCGKRKAKLMTGGNITPEAFSALLEANGGTLALMSDEGGFFKGIDRYTSNDKAGGDLDNYLKAWSGGRLDDERKSVDASVEAGRVHATILFCIQPSVAAGMFSNSDFDSRGFNDRFLIGDVPIIPRREFEYPDPLDPEVPERYRLYMGNFCNRDTLNDGAVLQMTPAASQMSYQWIQRIEDQSWGKYLPIRRPLRKFHASALRMAGLLHLAWGGDYDRPVDESTMADALKLADYFIQQRLFLIDKAGTEGDQSLARRVHEWAQLRPERTFTVRDLCRLGPARKELKTVDDAKNLLALMLEANWIGTSDPETWDVAKPGIPPATFWPLSVEMAVTSGFATPCDTLEDIHRHPTASDGTSLSVDAGVALSPVALEVNTDSFFLPLESDPNEINKSDELESLETLEVCDTATLDHAECENASAQREYDIDERTGRKVYRKSGLV